MLPALATLDELEIRLGETLSGTDAARAEGKLNDASALIRATAGTDWVNEHDELENVPDIVVAVCLAVSERAYKNPDGVRSEGLGDYQVTYAGFGSGIYLTDQETALVRRASRGLSVWTLATTREDYETGDLWVSDGHGGDLMPFLAGTDFGMSHSGER